MPKKKSMGHGRRKSRRLLIPAAMLALSIALPVIAVLLASQDDPSGWGGGLAILYVAPLTAPLYVAGYIWLLVALLRRRPVRRDSVGWLVWVSIVGMSSGMVLIGKGVGLSIYAGEYGFAYAEGAAGLLGLAGLIVAVVSLIGRSSRAGRESE